tara:strand:+ start:1937 stop:4045 length:2109 start_codon:yes stop_codon:yes gene_type:complete
MSDTDNKEYIEKVQRKIKAHNKPGDVLSKESKILSNEIKKLSQNIKDINKIDFENVIKINKKSSIIILNNDGILDDISVVPKRLGIVSTFNTLDKIVKYAKVNIKLNLKEELYDNINTEIINWLNNVHEINIKCDNFLYKIQFGNVAYESLSTSVYEKNDRNIYKEVRTQHSYLLAEGKIADIKYTGILLIILTGIRQFNKALKNKSDTNKISSRNLFKLIGLDKLPTQGRHIKNELLKFDEMDESRYCTIDKINFNLFNNKIKELRQNNNENNNENNTVANMINMFKENIYKILIKNVEYGIFNTKTEGKFIKSKKEYVSYITRIILKLKQRHHKLRDITRLPQLFKKRLDLEKETYLAQLELYHDEITDFNNSTKKIVKIVKIKNSNLVKNDLKETFDLIVNSVNEYNRMNKLLIKVNKHLKKNKKTITNKVLSNVELIITQVEYIKYDITYYILLITSKIDILRNGKYDKLFNINVSRIMAKVNNISPIDIKRELKKRKSGSTSTSTLFDSDKSSSNFNTLELRNILLNNSNILNNNNSNLGVPKSKQLMYNGREIFIPYIITSGFIKVRGILNLSKLYNEGEIKMYNKLTHTMIHNLLYDRGLLILNEQSSKLNDPLRWKVLDYDKVKNAFGSKKSTLIKRTIFNLVTNRNFYTQKTVTWGSNVDNIKKEIIKFCNETSPTYHKCDYVTSLEELEELS